MLTFNLAAVDLCRRNFLFSVLFLFCFLTVLFMVFFVALFRLFSPHSDLVLGPLSSYATRVCFYSFCCEVAFPPVPLYSGQEQKKNCLSVIYGAEFVLTWQLHRRQLRLLLLAVGLLLTWLRSTLARRHVRSANAFSRKSVRNFRTEPCSPDHLLRLSFSFHCPLGVFREFIHHASKWGFVLLDTHFSKHLHFNKNTKQVVLNIWFMTAN